MREVKTIPGLASATAIHFGGKWLTINSAEDIGDGWVTLDVSPYATETVRASAIQGVRFSNSPAVAPVPQAFDIGA